MNQTRRSVLSAIGLVLPFGIGTRREGFSDSGRSGPRAAVPLVRGGRARRPSPATGRVVPLAAASRSATPSRSGPAVQGCHNDRPFAGFPAGHLRIVRAGSEPGPIDRGVRLYVSTVDVALTGGLTPGIASRPLDFASLPPAPSFS